MPALPLPVRVPPTKLIELIDGGLVIALECACGCTVAYPGHPSDQLETSCGRCGSRYTVAPVSRVASQGA